MPALWGWEGEGSVPSGVCSVGSVTSHLSHSLSTHSWLGPEQHSALSFHPDISLLGILRDPPRTRHAIPFHEPPPHMGGDGESLGGRGTSRFSPSPQGKRSGKGHLHVPMPSAPVPSPREANAIPARQLPPPLCCSCLPPHPPAASAAKASQPLQSSTSPSLRLRFIGVPSAERGWLCVCLYTRIHIYRYVPREALSSCADLHKYPIICAAPSAGLAIVLTHVKLFSTFQQQL